MARHMVDCLVEMTDEKKAGRMVARREDKTAVQ